jgi:ribosomal subunit interface protein
LDVDVVGRKDEVPDDLRERAKAKVAKLGRLAPVLERAEVRLAVDRDAPAASRKLCEVTLTGHGHTVRAKAVAHELGEAVDKVVDKLEHQVERMKGKLIARSHPRRSQGGGRAGADGDAGDAGADGDVDAGAGPGAGSELEAEV